VRKAERILLGHLHLVVYYNVLMMEIEGYRKNARPSLFAHASGRLSHVAVPLVDYLLRLLSFPALHATMVLWRCRKGTL
jgi:hypothetical protein